MKMHTSCGGARSCELLVRAYIRIFSMVAPYKELGRTYARAILGIGNLDFMNQNATQFRNTKTKKGLG